MSSKNDSLPVPRKRGRPPKNAPKIDLELALKLRLVHGLTYAEIGARFGVGKSAVKQRLNRFTAFIEAPDAIAGYRNHKADILESVELRLAASLLDPAKLEKASLNNVAYSYRQVSDMVRLASGKSTSNIMSFLAVQREAELILFKEKKKGPGKMEDEGREDAKAVDGTVIP